MILHFLSLYCHFTILSMPLNMDAKNPTQIDRKPNSNFLHTAEMEITGTFLLN